MESNLILSSVNLDTLLQAIRDIVKEEIKAQQLLELQERLFSPKETCELFRPKISLPTLVRWSHQEILPRHDLGGRVWYKYSDILNSLKTLKKYNVNEKAC